MTERGQRMLKRTVRRSHQLSAKSIAKDPKLGVALHHQVECKALYAVA
ncbi:unnamed protein product [Staurois parvus]|uniref:Uncharacterized protein n=1 Tax=Staurois parvus TaxID=386267 RepID=A0ABN9GFN8_9NEOB|nr:unnamed protein product [Staurois parvus]